MSSPVISILPIFLLGILLIHRIEAQQDLVQNSGFVSGTITGWTCNGNGPNNTCGTITAAGVPDFMASLDLGTSITQSVNAGNKLPYLAQYDCFCLNFNRSIPCNGIPVTISVGDDSGTNTVQDFIQHFNNILTPSGTNNKINVSFPNNQLYANQQVFLDNITLYALAQGPAFSSPKSILSNGGFEKSTNSTGINNGWSCAPGGCCSVELVGNGQFADEGINFLALPPGCSLQQTTSAEAGKDYTLSFGGYCLNNNTGCDTSGNLGALVGNPVNNFAGAKNLSFNLAKGDIFSGPYGSFNQRFTAIGNDTISITSAWPVRLDNFTLFLTSDFTGPSTPNNTNPNQGSGSGSGSSSNTGAIVGGVVGGLAILAVAVVGTLFWRRRAHQKQSENWGIGAGSATVIGEKPSQTPPNNGFSYPPPPNPSASTSPPPLSQATHTESYPSYQSYGTYGGGHVAPSEVGESRPMLPEIQDDDHMRPDQYPSYR